MSRPSAVQRSVRVEHVEVLVRPVRRVQIGDRRLDLDRRDRDGLQIGSPARGEAGQRAEGEIREPGRTARDRVRRAQLGMHQRQRHEHERGEDPRDDRRRSRRLGRAQRAEQPSRADDRAQRDEQQSPEADAATQVAGRSGLSCRRRRLPCPPPGRAATGQPREWDPSPPEGHPVVPPIPPRTASSQFYLRQAVSTPPAVDVTADPEQMPARSRAALLDDTFAVVAQRSATATDQPVPPGHRRGVGQLCHLVDDHPQPCGVVGGGVPGGHQSAVERGRRIRRGASRPAR